MLAFLVCAALLVGAEVSAQSCGIAAYPQIRVVNGVEARANSWPWQALVQRYSGGRWVNYCGGTLIDSQWVLTSASCFTSGYSYRVVLGKHSVSTSEFGEVTPPLSLAVWHSYWNPSMPANGYDIAMFKIASPVALSSKVRLACLPSANQILPNNYPCYATGWGSLDTSGPFPSALQQASLPVVDYATCSQPSWWGSSLRSSVICAGGSTRSACYGDGGGPLNCQRWDNAWVVQGIASYVSSLGCNTIRKPTVFTRVSAYNSWISAVMSVYREAPKLAEGEQSVNSGVNATIAAFKKPQA
ncbi:chymotrypsin-like elastase family member 2A [Petromyzon marinus]|uniref:chymotrypsin-like elastase family member 2A n=1 Tax=Petromyzon marinus TaxID=7757 RepID=UPI003F72D985